VVQPTPPTPTPTPVDPQPWPGSLHTALPDLITIDGTPLRAPTDGIVRKNPPKPPKSA
jgi:hypothetical protein